MALSNEERERIREEEWVRLQAREDFYRANPQAGPQMGPGPAWGWGRRGPRPLWFPAVMLAIILGFVILNNVVRFIHWDRVFP